MKRRDLEKHINTIAKERGLTAHWSEGGSHSKVKVGNAIQVVPRHREISERLARAIIKDIEENA